MDALRAAFMDSKLLGLPELATTRGPARACNFDDDVLSLRLRRTIDTSERADEVRRRLSTFDRFEARDWARILHPEREGDGGGDCFGDGGERVTMSSSSESIWMMLSCLLCVRRLRLNLCRLRAGW